MDARVGAVAVMWIVHDHRARVWVAAAVIFVGAFVVLPVAAAARWAMSV